MEKNDFLSNPEERISSFGNRVQNIMEKTKERDGKVPIPMQKSQKHKKEKIDLPNESRVENTVQIRISVTIEQKIRDIILSHYKKTGEKISLRAYADKALLFYVDSLGEKD